MNLHPRTQRRLIKRFALIFFLFPLLFFLFSSVQYVLSKFGKYDLTSPLAVSLFTLAAGIFLYRPAELFLSWALRKIFTEDSQQPYQILGRLSREAGAILDRQELCNLIVNTFGEMFDARTVSILGIDRAEGVYKIVSSFGLSPTLWRSLSFGVKHPFIELLKSHPVALEREHLRTLFTWQEANQLTQYFDELQTRCIVPILHDNELLGTINLAPKEANRSFTAHHIRSFSDFAKEIALAFRNATAFSELKEQIHEMSEIQSKFLHTAQHSAIHELATGIAHEIHNPLTIISGKAQILLLKKDQKFYDEQVEEVLKTIVKQTKRASDITRKLLMFADSEKSVREPIDFEGLINDIIALVSYQVSLDEIQVIKRLEHPIPKFFGNLGELREAFLNLFLNAVQAIGKKGTIQVNARYRKTDKILELRVSDSGPGISEEYLIKIFHPFFTTRVGGTGLGLFVTQQIIHGYGGIIRAESKPNHGTTFIVELPCEYPKAPQKDEEQDKVQEAHPEGHLKS